MKRLLLVFCLSGSIATAQERDLASENARLRAENKRLRKQLAESEAFGKMCAAAAIEIDAYLKNTQRLLNERKK